MFARDDVDGQQIEYNKAKVRWGLEGLMVKYTCFISR